MPFPQPARLTIKHRTHKYIKECRVCKCEGRSYMGHNIGECDYISRAEKRSISSVRVDVDHNNEPSDMCDDLSEEFDELQVDHPT